MVQNALNNQNNSQNALPSFAEGLNFYKLFWLFFIGAFLGVVMEMLWCFIRTGTIESRAGLVFGPFNLVYGFGTVAITLCLYWMRDLPLPLIYGAGMLTGASFEYICSYVQEKLFGTVSWDYSQRPFNIQGRTCLLYACYWGILSVVWIKACYPFLSNLIEQIPNELGIRLTWVLMIFMLDNTIVSACAVDRMAERYNGMPAQTPIGEVMDERFPDERMEKIYTNMEYTDLPAPVKLPEMSKLPLKNERLKELWEKVR